MHDHAEVLIENGNTVMINVHVDFVSQSLPDVMINNGSIDISRNCYVDYGSRTKVPIKTDSAQNYEKQLS